MSSGCGLRRYKHFLILFIPTPLVSALFGSSIPTFTAVESAERKAMKAAMKCLYWLTKQEIPHTTNFTGLLQLVPLVLLTSVI